MALAVAMASALVAWSCGGGGGGSAAPTPLPSASTVTITITGQGNTKAFSPNPAVVSAGQMVVFKNSDPLGQVHHIILDDGSAQTADIPGGATSAPVAMGTSGSLTYHCQNHPGMVGAFNGATAEPPPNCNQAYC